MALFSRLFAPLLALTLALLSSLARAEIDPQDQASLLEVYDAFTNKGFLEWNVTADLCTQPGVKCDTGVPQRVISLTLTDNALHGSISPSLGKLSKLQAVFLNNNRLTSTIPSEVGLLTELLTLHLSLNKIDGTIPKELAELKKVTSLYLNFNAFTGSLPSELGLLTNLEVLLVESNQLTGSIPASFGNLERLSFFKASNNLLTGTIPVELATLTSLGELSLHDNLLEGPIPREFMKLETLDTLYLATNKFDCPVWDYSVFPQNDYKQAEDICINALPPADGWVAIVAVLTVSVLLLVGAFVGVIFFRRTRAAMDGYSEIQEA